MRDVAIGISYTGNEYVLNHYQNKRIVNTMRLKNHEKIRQMFNGFEEEARSMNFSKDYKDLHIYMNTLKKETRQLIIEDYNQSIKSEIISEVVERIYDKKQSSEIVEIYPASIRLQKLAQKLLISGALIGIGLTLASSMQKVKADTTLDDLAVVEPIPIITEEEQHVERTETERAIEQQMAVILDESVIEEETLYNQPLMDIELQEYMKEISKTYDIPFQVMMTIAHVESGGNFNNNGVISSSDDYGYMQINKVNLEILCEELNVTVDEILNEPRVNIEASAYLLKNIKDICIKKYGEVINEEMYGMYNGWKNWKDKPISLNYVEKAKNAQQEFYTAENMLPISELTGMKIQ